MAGTVVADTLQAASTSTLVLKNGVANTPPTIQDSAGTQIGTFCRAWVNFNGTGAIAIRADFNVTDITDNGVGDYTVNIDNDMPDASYAVSASSGSPDGSTNDCTRNPCRITSQTASAVRYSVMSGASASTNVDVAQSCVAIFR